MLNPSEDHQTTKSTTLLSISSRRSQSVFTIVSRRPCCSSNLCGCGIRWWKLPQQKRKEVRLKKRVLFEDTFRCWDWGSFKDIDRGLTRPADTVQTTPFELLRGKDSPAGSDRLIIVAFIYPGSEPLLSSGAKLSIEIKVKR